MNKLLRINNSIAKNVEGICLASDLLKKLRDCESTDMASMARNQIRSLSRKNARPQS